MLVALHGLPRCGKDTAASYLVENHGFVRFAFGDAIYTEVADAFGVTEEQLRSDDWKRAPQSRLALEHCKNEEFRRIVQEAETPHRPGVTRILDGAVLDRSRTSRFILQRWATEYRRATDQSYWINVVAEKMAKLPADSRIVITDLREAHEDSFLMAYTSYHHHYYSVIEIVSWRSAPTNHSSDARLNPERIEVTVENNGYIVELYAAMQQFVNEKIEKGLL